MCGIAGFLAPPGRFGRDALAEQAARACTALAHRGPDDAGSWLDAETGVALAHTRLSIIDLTREGAQPMASADGRYVLVYNGEIYNYRALRDELAASGATFHSHSDTEVLLAAITAWGLEAALKRCNGMFALALWDRRERNLSLARDRLGQKPLYYGRLGPTFAFASELKALRHHPDFRGGVDRDALTLFLRYGNVPTPYSIYRGIGKLPPGCWLTLPFDGGTLAADLPAPVRYWSACDAAERGRAAPYDGSPEEAADELDRLLRDAVRACMVSDVPLGAFLSGGIDSSTVVAMMQAQSAQPVRTFSIGFREQDFDEAVHAKEVARHLGTDHTELYVTAGAALDLIPRLGTIYDEPFADSSQIPTYFVSELACRHVTVSLSGDGGDELFGGYNRYLWGRNLQRAVAWAPRPLRHALAQGMRAFPIDVWDRAAALARPALPQRFRHLQVGDKVHKLATIIGAASADEMYRGLISAWQDPAEITRGGAEARFDWSGAEGRPAGGTFIERMMLSDTVLYLPDDILVKLDRAAMAVSLETRVPLLDHRVVEFVWRLPLALKLRDGRGKWLLRQVLHRYMPRHLIERPKMGFGVPIGDWLRGDLRDWADALLDKRRLEEAGHLNAAAVRHCWQDHLSGRRNWQYRLWPVLMFEAWRDASHEIPLDMPTADRRIRG